MNKDTKKGSKGLILLFLVMVGFVVYTQVVAPLLNKKEEKGGDDTPEKTEKEILEENVELLYKEFSLTLHEESVLVESEKSLIDDNLSLYKMADTTVIYLGIRNVDPKYITTDGGYNLKQAYQAADGNYYYSGKYIMMKPVKEKLTELFGSVPVKYQDVTLDNMKYVYNEDKDRYELWKVKKETTYDEEKFTYKDYTTNKDSLYIYEYVAYTNKKDADNMFTRTNHSEAIPMLIDKDNIKDNLSHIDKYRYEFEKQENGTYLFKSVQWEKE